MYKIYALKLKNDDKIYYIGLTKQDIKLRLNNHLNDFRNNSKKTNWCKINKYNIIITILHDNINTLVDGYELEKYYINLYKSDFLVNTSSGGYGGSGIKMDEKLKNKHRNRMLENNPMKNKDISNKASESRKGKKISEEHKFNISKGGKGKGVKSIIQYDLNFNIIKVWDSITQINLELGYDISSIVKCCKGKYKTTKNYIWKYNDNNAKILL